MRSAVGPAVLFLADGVRARPRSLGHFTVFVLAVVIGYNVIGKVTTRCTHR